MDALPHGHPIKDALYAAIRESSAQLHRLRQVRTVIDQMGQCDCIDRTDIRAIQLGTGVAMVELSVPRSLFYQTLSEQSGLEVKDDGDLLQMLTMLSAVKTEYDKVSQALQDVRENGYGIVVPSIDELQLEEPEIVKQGGRYGVKLKASAPSIHMIRADIQTMLSPIVGSEKQSEEMIHYLLQEFEGDIKQNLAVQYVRKILPRAGQRGPAGQAHADAGRCAGKTPGDPGAHHQRGHRRAHLYHPVRTKPAKKRPSLHRLGRFQYFYGHFLDLPWSIS